MRKLYLAVSASIVFSTAVLAQVKDSQPEHAGVTIVNIRTVGNRSISTGEILAKVHSRLGQLFEPDTAAEDAKRIASLAGVDYAYYNTAIIANQIQLTFVVVEQNIVRSIIFVGNRKYKDKQLADKLSLNMADYLDTITAEADRKTLTEFYQKKGYTWAKVTLDGEKLQTGQLIFTIDEGPRVRIESVRFRGNKIIKTETLEKAVKVKDKKWWFWPRYYRKDEVDKALTKLQNAYSKRGFLDTKVTSRQDFTEDKSKVHITFAIDEGSRFTVEAINFTGNKHFENSQLSAEMKLQQGQIYSELKANSDVSQILKLYREIGYIDAKVRQKRQFVSDAGINVEFEITEGQRFRIGRIDITGNEQTHDKVVRRVLSEYDFQPGLWYNADIARGDGSGYLEKRVKRMAVTEAATITPTGEVPGQRNAQVNIIEGQTGMVMLGGGVASDSGVVGQLVFDQKNFDISDWPENFGEFITGRAFKGAGQNLRISLQPGTVVSEYLISFSEPYFLNKPVTLDVVGSSWERSRESYDEGRLKGYVGLEKRYKDRWRRGISFRAENVDVDSLDGDAPQEIIDVKGDNMLVGIRLALSRDLTDAMFNPSKGYSFIASYEQVGGDHTFGILSGAHRYYKTLYEDFSERKTILATKLLAATIVSDAPPFEKFYAGGTGRYGLRGFDYRGVSTRGMQTSVPSPKRKDPIGSDWIILANAEVTVPIVSDNLAALFFIDSGAIDSGNYRASVGTGIQILIPQWFGPVPMRFEIAAPLMKDDADDTQAFSFSIGKLF